MMDLINKPLGWVLEFCSTIVGGNYLFAILIFAIFVEIILLPFGIKQQKNSIKQARLRPKEMAIRKKYAGRDDKPTQQKMTQEIQELYQKEGYSPLSGCLPLLIQFPLLIALYQIVVNPLQYICGLSSTAITQIEVILGTGGTSQSMSLLGPVKKMGYEAFKNVEGFTKEVYDSMPDLNIFGVLDLSVSPSECMNTSALTTISGWLILSIPVLTFLAYFFSMRLTRKFSYQPMNDAQQAQTGCSNKVMDIVMPLLSVFICFGVPAALGVYWIFKSILGVVKQATLSYVMPLPKFTEEDYKAAEREVGARAEKTPKKSGRVVRSLHHIDDEDFEDTAEKARAHREALEAQEADSKSQKAPAEKKKGMLEAAPIKDDERKSENVEDLKSEDKE